VLGGLAAAAVTGALGAVAGDQAVIQTAYAAGKYDGDVLMVLSLRGGFDGLSAIVPWGDPHYRAARPDIAVPTSRLIAHDGPFGLHPALRPLLPLWQEGTFGAVHAVGQVAPNRSHFKAMDELERAAPGTTLRTGWLDRLIGRIGTWDPFNAVSVGSARPTGALTGSTPSLGLKSIDEFSLLREEPGRYTAATLTDLYAGAPAVLAQSATRATSALATTTGLAAAGYEPANGAEYPRTDLGRALKDAARLIKADVGLMSVSVDSGDWDMHENLGTADTGKRLHDNLFNLSSALAAFAADLGEAMFGKVTVVTVSEFGRRVEQNGSGGVDHGYGNAMLVLGGGVNGGRVHGRWPGLAPHRLVNGDLAVTSDYRAVIAEILRKRCGLGDTASVFPGVRPTSLGLVRS
jgi:uncharacterized protein (DUF1501 family)